MDAIDRLGWAAAMSFTAYGLRVGIRANHPAVLTALGERLPPERTPAPTPTVDRLYSVIVPPPAPASPIRRFNHLYADAARLVRDPEPAPIYDALERDLKLYLAAAAPRRLFVHAGVVGWRGRAIVVPGRTFSGKSTLVAALVRAGATYYSDEYAVLDARGRVHPYATRLSLRDGAGERRLTAAALGGETGRAALPVGLILMARYRAQGRFRPRPISAGQAVLALLGHTVAVRTRPRAAFSVLPRAVAGAVALRGVRGEADEVAAELLRRCA
jgi:hypothetical protein